MFEVNTIVKTIFVCVFLTLITTRSQGQKIDSIYTNWNRKTIEWLNEQNDEKKNFKRKDEYKNRQLNIFGILNIKDEKDINKDSRRYKLLRILKDSILTFQSPYYIIEYNESGAKVILKTFIVRNISEKTKLVDVYLFIEQNWRMVKQCQVATTFLSDELKNYLVDKGTNSDDVIISKVENGSINESIFYLPGTLSKLSGVIEIDNCYEKYK